MKKVFLLFITLVFTLHSFAQEFHDYLEVSREVLKTEKKALIAEVMQLSKEKSPLFWPLYNEYESKKYLVNTKYFNLVEQYIDNFDKMTPELAIEIINKSNEIDMELLKLEKAYAKKFLKIISPQKTLKYFQAENKIKAFIDAELAMQIPLLEELED